MWFHMGVNMHQRERVFVGMMTATSFKLKENGQAESLSTASQANDLIGVVDEALSRLMKQRADLGSYSNRLEMSAKGLMNAYENIQASESRIRDADMAEEMVRYTTGQILQQSGTAMLAQANQKANSVMRLLARD
jgi:flagellin